VTDKLSVTGGYRYTWSRRASTTANFTSVTPTLLNGTVPSQFITINGMPATLLPGVFKTLPNEVFQKLSFKKGTYTLAAQYQFSPDFMIYATTRQGYNPGGRNSRAPVGQEVYGPEVVTDYEIGVKRGWNMGDLRGLISFDVYRDNYNDAQRNTTQPVNGVPTVYIANVAKGRIQGFDLDGTVRYNAFSLTGFVTLTDAKYLEYPNNGQLADYLPPFDLTQIKLANTSKWVWGLQPSIEIAQLIDGAPDIVFSGNIYHRGAFASSEPNLGPDVRKIVPGNTTLDLRLDWRKIRGSNLSAAFAVTNVTDFNGKIGGNELRTTNGTNLDVFMPPRAWYAELNYKF
jgi:iron complex outermembrane recepter protein